MFKAALRIMKFCFEVLFEEDIQMTKYSIRKPMYTPLLRIKADEI